MSGPIAIFPWGEVIETFLDPLGLTADDFATRMRGGWLFGYVAGLAAEGRSSIIIYASERVSLPQRLMHAGTGAPIWLVPGRRSGAGRTRRSPSLQAIQQWRLTPWAAFEAVLQVEGCSAVLVQDYEHPRFDVLALLARANDLPLYASFQGGEVTLSALEARVRRRTLALCQGLIVPSARERRRLIAQHRAPEGKLHDIPNPVDVKTWRALPRSLARAGLGVPDDTFLVVWHGRIDIHRKGLDRLLQAWRVVRAARPGARLKLLGAGQDNAPFAPMAAAAPGVEWNATYSTDPSALRQWLSAADAYVSLSRVEGMPVAPLEAMACGLPVVASDAHGLADIFADGEAAGGVIVPNGDPAAAASALLRLADDKLLRARLGAAARRRVEDHYSIGSVGRGLARVFATSQSEGAAAAAGSRAPGAPCPG